MVYFAGMHFRRSGYVWLCSGLGLGLYALLGLVGVRVPGIEELVALVSQAEGWEFMAAGFLAILIEGLYFVGNFFPGTSIVMLLAILSSMGDWWQFLLTVTVIFLGWCLAGLINILLAYRTFQQRHAPEHVFIVHDNVWLTWLPAFRANYEVSQIAAGGRLREVLFSALRVRLVTAVWASGAAALIAYTVDLTAIDNQEGFRSLLFFVLIMLYMSHREFVKAKAYADTD
jgi:hypothetical protein